MAAVQAPVEAPADLKRLAFVETAASNSVSYVTGTTAFAKACGYYTSAKETNALKGSLTKIEDLIKAYSTPVVSKVSEKYPAYMTTVDGKVDMAVTLLQQIWENRIVGPVTYPVTYARSAIAMAPAKVGELYASREAFFKSIEAAMEKFKTSAVTLPAELPAAIAAAIAEARSNLGSTHLFGKVRAAYDAVLKYPAVVSFIERTAPMAAKAVDLAAPYYASAKDLATPYVTKVVEVAEPYVAAIKGKVWADASSPAEAQ